MLTTLLSFVVVLGVVVFVHELGHFLAAKSVGIRVERFSLGYPPRMVGKKVGDTDYCISWLPLGGYVKMSGMIDESLENPESITGAPHEFMSKKTWQKALVISAGVIMNMILATGIYTGVTVVEGIPEVKEAIVDSVSPGLPAEKAGITVGDQITGVDGTAVATWDELVDIIHASPEKPITVRWNHEGESRSAELVPKRMKTVVRGDIREVGLIGIGPRASYRPAGFFEAVGAGFQMTAANIDLGLKSIGMLVSGKASVKELRGPLAIAKMSGESARGGAAALILFIAFISINIGLINILPVPVLDGGHLVMIAIEGVTRRPISVRIKVVVQQVGMVLLLLLMAVIIWNDAGSMGWFTKLKGIF